MLTRNMSCKSFSEKKKSLSTLFWSLVLFTCLDPHDDVIPEKVYHLFLYHDS
jgi:hypothetical protein